MANFNFYRYIIWTLFMVLYHFSFGQVNAESASKIDSLQNILKTIPENEKGAIYYELAQTHFKNADYPKSSENYDLSIECSKKEQDVHLLIKSMSGKCLILIRSGDYNKALDMAIKEIEIATVTNDLYLLFTAYDDFRRANYYIGNYEEIIETTNICVDIAHELQDSNLIAISYKSGGYLYMQLEEYDKSESDFLNAIEIFQLINNQKELSYSHTGISDLYTKKGMYEKARYHVLLSIEIKKSLNESVALTESMVNLAWIQFHLKEFDEAIVYFEEVVRTAKELKADFSLQKAYDGLYETYKAKGDYEKAVTYLELYLDLKSNVDLNKAREQLTEMELNKTYEQEKEKVRLKQEKDLAIEKERKKQQEILSIVIGFGALILIVFSFILFKKLKESKNQHNIIQQAHKEIRDSINYAERIQRSFLATDELLNSKLGDHFVYYKPKDTVSGDFYWASELSNGNFAVCCADSTGHGVPGAIMSILNISSIERTIEKEISKPSEIFNETRKLIIDRLKKDGSTEGGKDGMDASLISINPEKTKLEYVAGNNPIWIIRNGELIDIKAEKMPIGKHELDNIPFQGGEFELQKGDQIYIMTDGYQDQFGGPNGKKFKVKPMKQMLLDYAGLTLKEQLQKISETFELWKVNFEQLDDVCILGIKI